MSVRDPIIVIFSKEQVRQRKLAHFLKRFGPAALPAGPELAALMGRFQFLVEGYDHDPQELYAITEVRRFYQHFHQVWPHWFFFCDLDAETLTMMTLCLIPNLIRDRPPTTSRRTPRARNQPDASLGCRNTAPPAACVKQSSRKACFPDKPTPTVFSRSPFPAHESSWWPDSEKGNEKGNVPLIRSGKGRDGRE